MIIFKNLILKISSLRFAISLIIFIAIASGIGTSFGLASSPCITPVLATLLAWVSQAKNPTISIIFLFFFGIGQVTPLIVAGATAENLKQFLALRKFSQIIPTLSGIFLVSLG